MADVSRASFDAALEVISILLDQQDPNQWLTRRDGRSQPIELDFFKRLKDCIAVVLGVWVRVNAESAAIVWGGSIQITREDLQDYFEKVFENWNLVKVPEFVGRPKPQRQGFLCGVIRGPSQAQGRIENKMSTRRKATGKEPERADQEWVCPARRPGQPVYLQVVPSSTSGLDFMRGVKGEWRFVDEEQNYVPYQDVKCYHKLDAKEVLNSLAQKTVSEEQKEEEWVKDHNINLGIFLSQVEIWKEIHGDDENTLARIIRMNGSGMESVIRGSVDQLFNFLEQPRNSLETYETFGCYYHHWKLNQGNSPEQRLLKYI